jgi:cell division protease FtsH
LSRMTSGFTGADIENLLNESAILAARANRKVIIMSDILEGINKVIVGPQKRSRIVTEFDKRITAYHEVGHAIVAKILPGCDEVQEVSIIPRGQAAGYTLTRPERDDQHITKGKLMDRITMLLGGRAAEDIVIHDISTGASSDIRRASDIARTMVTEWGMSSLGNIYLGGSSEVFLGKDFSKQHNYSEQIAGKIDEEVKIIIDESYKQAKEILNNNRNIMDNMVRLLFEKETIYAEEVDMLFKGMTVEEIIESIDKKTKEREAKLNDNQGLIIKEPESESKDAALPH